MHQTHVQTVVSVFKIVQAQPIVDVHQTSQAIFAINLTHAVRIHVQTVALAQYAMVELCHTFVDVNQITKEIIAKLI